MLEQQGERGERNKEIISRSKARETRREAGGPPKDKMCLVHTPTLRYIRMSRQLPLGYNWHLPSGVLTRPVHLFQG